MKTNNRWQGKSSAKMQHTLLRRSLVYFAACVLFTVLPILLGRVIYDPSHLFVDDLWPLLKQYSLLFICLLFLTPLLAYDVLRLTDRVATPIDNLRNQLQKLADGGPVRPLPTGRGDSWDELAASFNAALARVESLERAASPETVEG